jgi:arylsulfatase A-like enzyme
VKSPALRTALSLLAPILALALTRGCALSAQNRYVELGMLRSTFRVTGESLGAGLVAALIAAAFAALVALPLVRGAARLLRRLPGAAAAILVVAAAGWALWEAGSRLHGSELFGILDASFGPSGAAAFLAGAGAAAGLIGALLARRPRAGWTIVALAALCTLLWAASLAWVLLTAASPGPGRPSIILVSLDTLRADRVGVYGYARPTTPVLDAFAGDAVVFEHAIASSPWTLPSHSSMLSSLHPHNHGALSPANRLGEEVTTLAEALFERGYATAAFTGGGYVSVKFGLSQGFETFRELRHEPTTAIVDAALRWLEEAEGRPVFLFVHTYEPHTPYLDAGMAEPAEAGRIGSDFSSEDLKALREGRLDPTPAERHYISDLYDGDVRSTDRALAGLLDGLSATGLLDRSMVIVTSDHGEELFERAVRRSAAHGHSLYEELIRIPMVIRYPPALTGGRRVTGPASLVDIAATVAGALEFPWPDRTDGIDLVRLSALEAGSEPGGGREVVLSEALRSGIPKRSLRSEGFKYIAPLEEGAARPELYDLAADPGERSNVAADQEELAARYAALSRAYAAAHEGGSEAIIDEELRDQLRALGYVE